MQGGLGERFNPAVLKTADPQGSVSSNLTASATHMTIPFVPATGLLASLALLQVSIGGPVLHVRLNRQAKRNALSDPLIQQLHTVFINLPEGVRAAMISGDGSHFCAGLDLSELVARDIHSGVLHSRMWHAAFDAIQLGSVPVVAALHGAVVGGGLELAAACHIRVADSSAYYGLPEGQRGIFVGGGGTVRIQRVVGTTVMVDMMLTGRLLNAAEGLQEHVVRYVVPAGQALSKARELAERIGQNSAETNWMIVNVLPRVQDLSHDDGLFMEQLNSNRQRPPEAEARLREFVDGKARPLAAPNKGDGA